MAGTTDNLEFPETRWSLIRRIQEAPTEVRINALEELCRLYWPAIYSFARYRGHSPAEAEDLTQGLFLQLLDRQSLNQLQPEAGRLRSWLIRSFENYRINQHKAENAQKRGGGWISVEITRESGEEWWDQLNLADRDTNPEQILDRIWAFTVLELALQAVGEEAERRSRGEIFRALRPALECDQTRIDYATIASELDMTPEATRKAAQRLRASYAKEIRAQIEQTVDGSGDVEAEFAALRAALWG